MNDSSLRVIYAGTSDVALPALRCIKTSKHSVVGVLTKHNFVSTQSLLRDPRHIIAHAACAWQIPVIHAPYLKTSKIHNNSRCNDSRHIHLQNNVLVQYESAKTAIQSLAPDIGVIVSYGVILGEEILSIPRFGWINLHFSLLPRFRGAAPVQRAIMSGVETSGFTIFRLDKDLDSGLILEQQAYTFSPHLNSGQEILKMAEFSAPFLVHTLDSLSNKLSHAKAQTGEVTYAPKLTSDECQIDWTQTSDRILRLIRAANPEPSAYFFYNNRRIKVLAATRGDINSADHHQFGELFALNKQLFVQSGDEPIELLSVQPEGKKKMSGHAFWCGLNNR